MTETLFMCAVCHAPLDHHVDEAGETLAFYHPAVVGERDHEPAPVPRVEADVETYCDFCSAPHPAWAYPAATFTVGDWRSMSAWYACDACHALIEAGHWEALVDRQLSNVPADTNAEALALVRTALVDLHARFAAARTGPATPTGPMVAW